MYIDFSLNELISNTIEYTSSECIPVLNTQNSIVKFETFLSKLNVKNNTFKNSEDGSLNEFTILALPEKYDLIELINHELDLKLDLEDNTWPISEFNKVVDIKSKTFNYKLNNAVYNEFYIIKNHTIWTNSSSPYYLNESLIIMENASLTIEEGVQVFYLKNTTIYSFGPIYIEGSAENYVKFSPFLFMDCNTDDYSRTRSPFNNLFYFSNQKQVSKFNYAILDEQRDGFNDEHQNYPVSALFIENGYTPQIFNVQISSFINGITIFKCFNSSLDGMKNVSFANIHIYDVYSLSSQFRLNLNNGEGNKMLIDPIHSKRTDYKDNTQSFSKSSLNCRQLIHINETDGEQFYYNIAPWHSAYCELKFKTHEENFLKASFYNIDKEHLVLQVVDTVTNKPLSYYANVDSYYSGITNKRVYYSSSNKIKLMVPCSLHSNGRECQNVGFYFKIQSLKKNEYFLNESGFELDSASKLHWRFNASLNGLIFDANNSYGYNSSVVTKSVNNELGQICGLRLRIETSIDFRLRIKLEDLETNSVHDLNSLYLNQDGKFPRTSLKWFTYYFKITKRMPKLFRLRVEIELAYNWYYNEIAIMAYLSDFIFVDCGKESIVHIDESNLKFKKLEINGGSFSLLDTRRVNIVITNSKISGQLIFTSPYFSSFYRDSAIFSISVEKSEIHNQTSNLDFKICENQQLFLCVLSFNDNLVSNWKGLFTFYGEIVSFKRNRVLNNPYFSFTFKGFKDCVIEQNVFVNNSLSKYFLRISAPNYFILNSFLILQSGPGSRISILNNSFIGNRINNIENSYISFNSMLFAESSNNVSLKNNVFENPEINFEVIIFSANCDQIDFGYNFWSNRGLTEIFDVIFTSNLTEYYGFYSFIYNYYTNKLVKKKDIQLDSYFTLEIGSNGKIFLLIIFFYKSK